MEKEKSLVKKKSKAPLIIGIVIGVFAIAAALFYFLYWRNREPEIVLTDVQYLALHAWEKEDAPTVIWTLKEDGTGELTTNKTKYYEMAWTLSENSSKETSKDFPLVLKIATAWLYELDDSFEMSINREEGKFTVKNLADGGESTFVPLGTAESKAAEAAETVEETEE